MKRGIAIILLFVVFMVTALAFWHRQQFIYRAAATVIVDFSIDWDVGGFILPFPPEAVAEIKRECDAITTRRLNLVSAESIDSMSEMRRAEYLYVNIDFYKLRWRTAEVLCGRHIGRSGKTYKYYLVREGDRWHVMKKDLHAISRSEPKPIGEPKGSGSSEGGRFYPLPILWARK